METILSHDFFMEHPEEFYRYLRTSDNHSQKKPNQAHIRLEVFREVIECDGTLYLKISAENIGKEMQKRHCGEEWDEQ